MRIALISPNFPPDNCGVGDYTARLAEELAREGHEVAVWTARHNPRPARGVLVRTFGEKGAQRAWSPAELARIAADVRAWRANGVCVQFSPNLYARRLRGVGPHLPVFIAALRATAGCPVALMAHEQNYPAGLRSLDRLVLGVPQLAIFQALCLASGAVFFSIEAGALTYRERYPALKAKFHWLPVASNIPVAPKTAEYAAFLERVGVRADDVVLLQFGTAHPTRLFTHAFAALERARRDGLRARFVAVGSTHERVVEELRRAGRDDLREHAVGLGYLPESEASYCLSRADVVLAPFLDGVSSRRTSVMAALAHSRPVVTTRAWSTDPNGRWDESTLLARSPAPDDFAEACSRLLADSALRERLANAGHEAYLGAYDWPVLGRRFADLLGRLR